MSKDKVHLLSPLFLRYQADFEKNPKSRVFAPLAEMYRKVGMTDKAMEILAQGIRYHQTYLMGHLGLAFCYYDIKQYQLAYNTLKPLVHENRDNIRLQKLFIDCSLALELSEEALEACKYLLFINPKDKEVSEIVIRLEEELASNYRHEHKPIFILNDESTLTEDSSERLNVIKPATNDFDNWQAVDLVREEKLKTIEEDKFDQWNIQKLDDHVEQIREITEVSEKPEVEVEVEVENEITFKLDLKSNEHDLLPRSISMDEERVHESVNSSESLRQEKLAKELPMITHTLVDLYCGQGLFGKAIEVLDKILELNPEEERTLKKKNEILALLSQPTKAEHADSDSEEDGRKSLMDVFDSMEIHELLEDLPIEESDEASVFSSSLRENLMALKEHAEIKTKTSAVESKKSLLEQYNKEVEEKLNKFLSKIRQRAIDYQESF